MKNLIIALIALTALFGCERASKSGRPAPIQPLVDNSNSSKVVILSPRSYQGNQLYLYKVKVLKNGTSGYITSKYEYALNDTLLIPGSKISY